MGTDGTTALYNSEMDAGASITNVTFNGDVTSGFSAGGTTGYPTRIIAGNLIDGTYVAGGSINNLVINGSLSNSVLAASVAPYGGDGSLPPPMPYGSQLPQRTSVPASTVFSNYNAPEGLTGNIKNYSIRSFDAKGNLLPGAFYDTTTDPIIHVKVLENGTVNVTVTGNVISTPHDDSYDFTGIFAANPNTGTVDGGPAS